MQRVAAVQMVSAPEVAPNLESARRLVAQAAAEGARLVALPEYFCILGRHESDKVKVRERDGAGPIQDALAAMAQRNRVWLVGGTVPIACADPGRARSACLVFDDAGRRVARYDKMHLFTFSAGDERYDEARTIEPGVEPVAVESPFGRLGLSVCYDLRFPELYRRFQKVDIWFVPSAFTAVTGAAHWETLLRARAIENLCYVVAPAQGGLHANGRRTHGHSMVVGPWGEVLAEHAEGEGVVVADIDTDRLAEVRQSLPALDNRRLT
ncbi:MAG: acyltransferase [Betaproteobacteria bacterium RIFCSPLOWO2_12_FULL_67_28]|nr:MAG: acyltransferase [Betaproteobacteria bacterium RIFCSPLOWO2_02_FULL_68_150]OGA70956.1 MAG: acyltransferase [Betaproteobacteria bacterium RIFCSPLOWO2_12_FULL_67_28]